MNTNPALNTIPEDGVARIGDNQPAASSSDADYWNSLIDERTAADFLGLCDRSLQNFRQRGDGPKYIRISSRCIRYRRTDLARFADERVRKNTSDLGPAEAA